MDTSGDSEVYCSLVSIEWVMLENKSKGGYSIIWKAMVQAYDLIGTGLVWRVGSGSRVQLGLDPWVGSGRSHLLPEVVCLFLFYRGILFLSQVTDPTTTNILHKGWLGSDRLGLVVEHWESWDLYV